MIKAELVHTKTKRGKGIYWYWRLYNTTTNKYVSKLGKHPINWLEAYKVLEKFDGILSLKERTNILDTLRINQNLSPELANKLSRLEKEILELLHYHRDATKPSFAHHTSGTQGFNPFQIAEELYFDEMQHAINKALKEKGSSLKELQELDRNANNLSNTKKINHSFLGQLREDTRRKFIKEKLRSRIYMAISNLRDYKLLNRTLSHSHPNYILRKKRAWSYWYKSPEERLSNNYIEERKALKDAKITEVAYRRFTRNKYYKPN